MLRGSEASISKMKCIEIDKTNCPVFKGARRAWFDKLTMTNNKHRACPEPAEGSNGAVCSATQQMSVFQQPHRCPWVDLSKPDYVAYHDNEWGVPVYDDRLIFEFLTLESTQAGLSWYTVLKKRDNYRRAFHNFNPQKIARYNQAKVDELLQNPGLIRNRLKIEATVNNAQRFLEVQAQYGSFSKYIWDFVGGKPKVNNIRKVTDYISTSKESDALSKDLKSRGFKFMGSTICYAHMQATGMVNDHTVDCFRRKEIIAGYN